MKTRASLIALVLLLGIPPASAASPVYTETLYGGLLDSIALENGANLIVLYPPGFGEVQWKYDLPLEPGVLQSATPPLNRLPDIQKAEVHDGWFHLTLAWTAEHLIWHVQWKLPDPSPAAVYLPAVIK